MIKGKSPLFVAEISGNHLGSFSRARELVERAVATGVGAVKFQTYTADTMTLDLQTKDFAVSDGHELWGGKNLYNLYQEAYTPWEWHKELFQICRDHGVIPFSSPFDLTAVDFLESLDAPMYKIASLETGDHRLIRRVAETGKPLIVSTGATTWDEIAELVAVVHETGNRNLTLLVCTSAYPADPADAHILRLATVRDHFGVDVGLSDHTLGLGVSIAAIALGATVIEKHMTLRRTDGGPDAAFSLEPNEFATLVKEGQNAFSALGSPTWSMAESEKESRRLRRSLYVVLDVKAGDLVTPNNLRSIRPGAGALPKLYDTFLGKRFTADISKGTPMAQDLAE